MDATAKKGRGRPRLPGSEAEHKKSVEISPVLNRLPTETLSHGSRNDVDSTKTMKTSNRASTRSEKAPASSTDDPPFQSSASLDRQSRKKAKTAVNDSMVLQGQAKESSLETSRSLRNSRPLHTHHQPQTNTRAPVENTRAAQTSRSSAPAAAASRKRDETIRTARTRIRPRTNKVSKDYNCERFSRRGIVSSMEVAAAAAEEEDGDDMDDDVDICLLPSGLKTFPDPDLCKTNSEEPLCLQLWIQSSLQKGSWCKPGKVVGVNVDGKLQKIKLNFLEFFKNTYYYYYQGVGPPSISSVLLGVVVDNYLSDLSDDRDRHSTLLVCLRGEVPVVLDSPSEAASFFYASKDDMVCIDNLGRVCLLSSVNRGNISETHSATANSNDETGMLFINDISINDNSEDGNSSNDGSVGPTQSSCCRLGLAL